ncbi:hypothetical protein KIN20_015789 [Parelaphostrongylus tenuis]|uniref:Uncharacterized protein n=1 Tax=Parelaphostrongylus tenuis TaxID=148309 RepID=A0AAD5MJ19_PARTN|nr:hypothetical protein KIN20_015789 [Parelaphostrongylus tenuis]
MINIMENNSVVMAIMDLKLPDENGCLKFVLNLPVHVLKRYCYVDQVANFANLTLFIYNLNATNFNKEVRLLHFILKPIIFLRHLLYRTYV